MDPSDSTLKEQFIFMKTMKVKQRRFRRILNSRHFNRIVLRWNTAVIGLLALGSIVPAARADTFFLLAGFFEDDAGGTFDPGFGSIHLIGLGANGIPDPVEVGTFASGDDEVLLSNLTLELDPFLSDSEYFLFLPDETIPTNAFGSAFALRWFPGTSDAPRSVAGAIGFGDRYGEALDASWVFPDSASPANDAFVEFLPGFDSEATGGLFGFDPPNDSFLYDPGATLTVIPEASFAGGLLGLFCFVVLRRSSRARGMTAGPSLPGRRCA